MHLAFIFVMICTSSFILVSLFIQIAFIIEKYFFPFETSQAEDAIARQKWILGKLNHKY